SPIHTLTRGPQAGYWRAVFSPDGRRLAASANRIGADAEVTIWDPISGKELCTCTAEGAKKQIRQALAFSPDGPSLAPGHQDGTLSIWDSTTGRKKSPFFRGHTQAINSVAFSPDGQSLASAAGRNSEFGTDGELSVWDVQSGRKVLDLRTPQTVTAM